MKRLLVVGFFVLTLLSGCRSSDPEAGVPLKLAEQVTVGAFQKMSPTVLAWQSLMPADYEPTYQEFPWMMEGDSVEAMEQTLQETPLVETLDGQEVKVSGYVVPLDGDEKAITEFLLVPFLGACTHVPPPPANQIVYVKPKYPLLMEESWGVVSVVGELSAEGRTSEYGAVGYEMTEALLAEFDESEYAGVATAPVVDGMGIPLVPPAPVDR